MAGLLKTTKINQWNRKSIELVLISGDCSWEGVREILSDDNRLHNEDFFRGIPLVLLWLLTVLLLRIVILIRFSASISIMPIQSVSYQFGSPDSYRLPDYDGLWLESKIGINTNYISWSDRSPNLSETVRWSWTVRPDICPIGLFGLDFSNMALLSESYPSPSEFVGVQTESSRTVSEFFTTNRLSSIPWRPQSTVNSAYPNGACEESQYEIRIIAYSVSC